MKFFSKCGAVELNSSPTFLWYGTAGKLESGRTRRVAPCVCLLVVIGLIKDNGGRALQNRKLRVIISCMHEKICRTIYPEVGHSRSVCCAAVVSLTRYIHPERKRS